MLVNVLNVYVLKQLPSGKNVEKRKQNGVTTSKKGPQTFTQDIGVVVL